MDEVEDEDDLKLVKASTVLLTELEDALPKLLWKRPRAEGTYNKVHSLVRRHDLDYVIKRVRLQLYKSNGHGLLSKIDRTVPG